MVCFAFKGQKSRADYFEYDGRYRGPRLHGLVRSEKKCIRVASEVYISDPQSYHEYEIGRDFRPETFLRVFGTVSLAGWLEHQLEPEFGPSLRRREMSVALDDNGVLHLSVQTEAVPVTRDPREEVGRTVKISFDTPKGYRPVYFERQSKRANHSSFTRRAKLEWARSGSAWYVSAFEHNMLPGNRHHTVGTIEQFNPDVTVSDVAFTLDGLGVLDGTFVHDSISRERYQYKSPKDFFVDREIPDKEADLVRAIRKQQAAGADMDGGDDANSPTSRVFYLRVYKTGRLIGPLSLKHGSLLPPLGKETYIVVEPTEYELELRKLLLESRGYESGYFDCEAFEVIDMLGKMLKRRLGDRAPNVRIDENVRTLITMKISKDESAYEVLFRIAAKTKARVFIEDGEVVLSRKKLTELANLDFTTSETAGRHGRPFR